MQLREELPLSDVIDRVLTRLRTADRDDQYGLTFFLSHLLTEAGRDQEALSHIEEIIESFPDDVRFPINRASHSFYVLDDAEEALRCIDFALQRAHRTGLFRREALGVKARILLELGRGEPLSRVLDEIMSLQMIAGVADIGRERDFVDRAPPGLIEEDVLRRYNEFRPKS
jgi:hypothetical protein